MAAPVHPNTRRSSAALLLLGLALAATTASAQRASSGWSEGIATFTDAPAGFNLAAVPSELPDAACGFGKMSQAIYPNFALAGFSFTDSAFAKKPMTGCGTCLEVACSDEACIDRTSRIITLYDECRECSATQLNLHALAFSKIAPLAIGRVAIRYREVPCPSKGYIVVNVDSFRASRGGYIKIAFKNVAGDAISSVSLAKAGSAEWRPMTNVYGGVWELSKLPDMPFDIKLADASGKSVVLKSIITSTVTGDVQSKAQF